MLANQLVRVECLNEKCNLHFLVRLEPGVKSALSQEIIGDRPIKCCIFCCGIDIKIIDTWKISPNQGISDNLII